VPKESLPELKEPPPPELQVLKEAFKIADLSDLHEEDYTHLVRMYERRFYVQMRERGLSLYKVCGESSYVPNAAEPKVLFKYVGS